jgi:translation initiation factor IF-3
VNSEVQEIKFRVNIDRPTYEKTLRKAEEFLEKGDKVRMQMQFRGREVAHQKLGLELMREIKRELTNLAMVEQEPAIVGKSVFMTLAPLPKGPAL